MQSINTNNLFMHGHKNWGASNIACSTLEKVRRQLPPLPLRFRGLCPPAFPVAGTTV